MNKFTVIGLTAVAAAMWNSGTFAQSLQEAVDKAVSSIPAVASAQSRRQSSEERVRVERGALFPTVNLRGESGPQFSDTPSTRGRAGRGTDDDGDTTLWRNEGRLVATQLLYDGGITTGLIDEAQNNLAAASHRINNVKQTVALQAIAAYIDVLRNRDFEKFAQENVKAHEQRARDTRRLVISGRASASDNSQADARLALAEANLANRTGAKRDAETRYFRAVGEAPRNLARINAPPDPNTINVEDKVSAAAANNPELKVAQALVESRKAAYEATDGLFGPNVNLELSASEGNHFDGVRGRQTDYRALIVATWNFYRGGSDSARAREASANLKAVKFDELDTMRFIRARVEAAFESFKKNHARIGPLQRRVSKNRVLIVAYKRQFELGKRTLLDLLDVQNELFVSRAELADAEHSRLFDYFDLLAASGELLSNFNIAREIPKRVPMFE